MRKSTRTDLQLLAQDSITIPAGSSKSIACKSTRTMTSDGYFIPRSHSGRSLDHDHQVDAIVTPHTKHIHVLNNSAMPIHVKRNTALGTIESLDTLETRAADDYHQEIEGFTFLMNSMIRVVKENTQTTPAEQAYQDEQPDIPVGPKTAEVPEFEDIASKELVSSIDFNPKLSLAQRAKLEKIVMKNSRAFSLDGKIGKYSGIQYPIKLVPDAQPVSLAPYHASPEKREAIDKQLDKWFSQGVIQASDSPWGAPVIVVYRNGKARVCIDYRKVNALTIPDEYPLPKQTDILRALAGSQWLSTFDALSGFHQIEIQPEHRPITAFRTHKEGLLEFTRLPFGLRNGPAVFQRVMNKVLAKFLWLYVLVYIDDIVVYSPTFDDHLRHLEQVLESLTRANITLSPPKCHIGYQSLILLGQRVSRLGVSTHKEKIDAVDSMKPPTKVKELQMFLGFVNYFANYIPFFTWITKPLYRLLSNDHKWEWTPIHQEAYELCKLALKSAPVLAHPMSGLGYRLYTDASDFGIGAVLQQVQPIKIRDLKGTKVYDKLRELYNEGKEPPQLVIIADKDEIRPVTEHWHDEFDETIIYIERVIAYWS